jgi:diguanylate cyclase (GGDEF)-like protein
VSLALVRYGNFRELSVRLFTLGWLCFIPSATLMAMHRLGFINFDMTIEILANGGWVLEMVLQAFALAVRYDMDQRSKLAAQQQAITARVRESAARSQALHHEQEARRALDEAAQAQREYSEALEQRVQQRRSELERIQQELAAISVTDALTGLHNRRFFTERFEQEVVRMQQLHAGLSLMLVDVDHFKRINDRHGHLAGDECLQQVAARLKAQLKRPSDVLCRYGGEEFAVLLPDTPLPGALAFAHAIRESVAAAPMQCEGVMVDTTISIGLMVVTAEQTVDMNLPGITADLWAEKLLHRADQALYQAKKNGRNCVCVAP